MRLVKAVIFTVCFVPFVVWLSLAIAQKTEDSKTRGIFTFKTVSNNLMSVVTMSADNKINVVTMSADNKINIYPENAKEDTVFVFHFKEGRSYTFSASLAEKVISSPFQYRLNPMKSQELHVPTDIRRLQEVK